MYDYEAIEEYIHYKNSRYNLYDLLVANNYPRGLIENPLIDATWLFKNTPVKSAELLRNPTLTAEILVNIITEYREEDIKSFIHHNMPYERMAAWAEQYPILRKYMQYVRDTRAWDYCLKYNIQVGADDMSYIAPVEYIEKNTHLDWNAWELCYRSIPLDILIKISCYDLAIWNMITNYTEIQLGYLRALEILPSDYPIMLYDDIYELCIKYPEQKWCLEGIEHDSTWEKLLPYIKDNLEKFHCVPSHLVIKTPEDYENMQYLLNITYETTEMLILNNPEYAEETQCVRWEFVKSHPELPWSPFADYECSLTEFIKFFGVGSSKCTSVDFNEIDVKYLNVAAEIVDSTNYQYMVDYVAKMRAMRPKYKFSMYYADIRIIYKN